MIEVEVKKLTTAASAEESPLGIKSHEVRTPSQAQLRLEPKLV